MRRCLLGLCLLVGCFGDSDAGTDADAGALRDAGAASDAGDLGLCGLPIVVGMCQAAFERWAWDPASESCRRFTYGGCDGNDNNFESPTQCLQACSAAFDGGLPGVACMVGDLVFPSGAGGIDDPFSCNTCVCDNGVLSCTEIGCPEDCAPNSKPGTQCAACGPADGCEVVDHRCLKVCDDNAACAEVPGAMCFGDGTCQVVCG